MLTTAQPNGRLYCTLHWFFFSPAPILPAQTHKGIHGKNSMKMKAREFFKNVSSTQENKEETSQLLPILMMCTTM